MSIMIMAIGDNYGAEKCPRRKLATGTLGSSSGSGSKMRSGTKTFYCQVSGYCLHRGLQQTRRAPGSPR